MSEAPKFDLSRIRLTNGMAKFKPNETALPKNTFSDTSKLNNSASQKTETPDITKADEAASQKTEIPDTFKADEVATQKTDTPDTAKVDEIATQKTDTPQIAKADEVATQKTEIPDTAKVDEIATQKTDTPQIAKADEVATQTTKLSSTKQKNPTESAQEIQKLLAPLKATYPTNSVYEKQVFVNKFREEIRKNFRVQELITDGGVELIKILCEPLDIPVEMGTKWLQTAQHYR
ncbi:hypothetical protein Riv7116_5411 [Rivularia sp. PCC 7116]|uniref:hypothetical protein n=1 Tax=Rivularia sp. PCC 7116 TaxID=373994 RepID=UPI00029F2530|nr:hypothetical protein [Rivularia sp. PCC 7116]AFY57788.1 hypothetical protein Riv7116_5411 [Rivularia sp. PCC 7116]